MLTKNAIGDDRLRTISRPVKAEEIGSEPLRNDTTNLLNALENFRKQNGFGRAMAAPQIGINKRMIALNLGDAKSPFVMINPEITKKSNDTFTLWDDCMSLPWLMVKVRRSKNIEVEYIDQNGNKQIKHMEEGGQSLAELLQHEIDHLDGVLMIDQAENGSTDVIAREEYLRRKSHFDQLVDYKIVPTIKS